MLAVGLLSAQLAAGFSDELRAEHQGLLVDAQAPTVPANIARGAKRLAIGLVLPTAGVAELNQAVGGAWFVADRLALTASVQIALDRQNLTVPTVVGPTTYTQLGLSIAPGARYYLTARAPVALFADGTLIAGVSRTPQVVGGRGSVGTGLVDTHGMLALAAGVGGEWFINPQVSLSGDMGLRLDILRSQGQPPVALATLATALRINFTW